MPGVTATGRSLAALLPGEAGLVESILFDGLRAQCGDVGINEGEVVRCRAGTGGMLILDTPAGKTVVLARDSARYVRVGPPP
jgi:hypothetical protein